MEIMHKLETLVRGAAFTGVALVSSLGMTYRANAEAVPSDFFATTDAKAIELGEKYNAVVPTPIMDDYYSSNTASKGVRWDDPTKTNVPAGYSVWALDADKKPCGLFNMITAGSYGFLHAYGDDKQTTPTIDEGASAGDIMNILVENNATGAMYHAQFVDDNYTPITVNFQGVQGGRYLKDILVDTNPIVPEPSTLVLIVSGALAGAGVALKRRLKK